MALLLIFAQEPQAWLRAGVLFQAFLLCPLLAVALRVWHTVGKNRSTEPWKGARERAVSPVRGRALLWCWSGGGLPCGLARDALLLVCSPC